MNRRTARLNLESLESRLTPAATTPAAPLAAAAQVGAIASSVQLTLDPLHYSPHAALHWKAHAEKNHTPTKIHWEGTASVYWSPTKTLPSGARLLASTRIHTNSGSSDNYGGYFGASVFNQLSPAQAHSGYLVVKIHTNYGDISGSVQLH